MTLYDAIGRNYAQTRRSEPRIAEKLLEILNGYPASTIVDVGAGTGSYAEVLADRGHNVLAVEPSETMRDQVMSTDLLKAKADLKIQWIDAFAESLPLADQVADAAIVMLAFHHFQDLRKALQEIHRVIGGGPLVLFTYDPDAITHFWLTQYFPSLIADVKSTFLPISVLTSKIEAATGKQGSVSPFLLPHDLSDSFAAVGWSRPELYLDHNVRSGISSFAKMSKDKLDPGLTRLRKDLESGGWDQMFGHLRQQQKCDLGYCFVYAA